MRCMSDPELDSSASSALEEASVSDARLVEEVRRGNQEGFGQLVRRYEARLINVIRRFVSDLEAARDLAQDTFLKAFERLDQFDPSRRFGPWLFRIGVNLSLDAIRRRKRRGWFALFSQRRDERPVDPPTRDPRVALDLEQEVRQVLEMIPEKYRMVLILRDLENFSTSEIAAITDRKEATIRWRLAEARREFQRLWQARLDGVEVPVTGSDARTSREPIEGKPNTGQNNTGQNNTGKPNQGKTGKGKSINGESADHALDE